MVELAPLRLVNRRRVRDRQRPIEAAERGGQRAPKRRRGRRKDRRQRRRAARRRRPSGPPLGRRCTDRGRSRCGSSSPGSGCQRRSPADAAAATGRPDPSEPALEDRSSRSTASRRTSVSLSDPSGRPAGHGQDARALVMRQQRGDPGTSSGSNPASRGERRAAPRRRRSGCASGRSQRVPMLEELSQRPTLRGGVGAGSRQAKPEGRGAVAERG